LADEKKPEFDPDKTVFDVRRPKPVEADADRTVVAPVRQAEPPPKPPAEDEERTVMMPRSHGAPAPAAPQDADRTVITPRGSAGAEAERTMVRQAAPGAAKQAAGQADFQLACLSGSGRGRRFPLGSGEVLVGSSPSCQVQLPGLESVHAKLLRQPDGYDLQNLGAAGSVVMSGGRKPSRAKLKSGDLVKMGDVVLRFEQVGEVFGADYDEKEFAAGLATIFAPENRLYLGLGALAAVLALVLLWPSGKTTTVVVKKADTSAADKQRKQEVTALLQAGEVLFNAGKLMTPADQPDADSAFAKFNEALALDPGNQQALQWLKRIDEERDKQRRAREEAEKQRLAEEQARQDRQRQELDRKVAAVVEQGDAYYEKGQITEPVGTNALAKYQQALKIDPQSSLAQERVQKAINFYILRGDELRDKNDLWAALENYRKASRATGGREEDVERRIHEVEGQLRSGMAGTSVKLVIYRDEKGQLFVLDDIDKVPARYRDRVVEVQPAAPSKGGLGR
jgi:tetratricopeptide (TPR) repeat protein